MEEKNITLSYGSGGRLTQQLINNVILKYFNDKELKQLDDSAYLELNSKQILFTTDSYTVSPIFFPGGDIGKLAVTGTANDLAVCGGLPLFISVGFIIEEGLTIETLEKIIGSMKRTAVAAGIRIVTGDTKVVQQGKGDKIFINTSGIATLLTKKRLSNTDIRKGDVIIINGGIGEHGAVIMSLQKGLDFEMNLKSDCAPLNRMIAEIIQNCDAIKFMRDPTRGGLATTLNEIIRNTGLSARIYEDKIYIKEQVKSLCKILGIDPLYLANEGKVLLIAARENAEKILNIMKKFKEGRNARIIGEIVDIAQEKLLLKTSIGTTRIIDVLTGSPLPRIC